MSLHELFAEKLQELAGVEKLLIAGFPALVAASTDAELQAAFSEHLEHTEKPTARSESSPELKTRIHKPLNVEVT